jgi:hypothetical protein
MKYVITWENLPNLTEESAKRSLQVFSKWSPTHPEHFQAFLGRIDGHGGFAVVETDDVTEIAGTRALHAVVRVPRLPVPGDRRVGAAITGEALAFAESVS